MNDFDENLFIVRGTVEYIQLNKIRNIHNNKSIFKCWGEPVGNGFVTPTLKGDFD